MNEKVDIVVFRRKLTVSVDGQTPLELKALATRVDEEMQRQHEYNTHVADSSTLAILTAMHFAGELQKMQDARQTEQMALERKVEELTLALRSSLSHVQK